MQRLGQHFLKNTGAITRIIDALDLRRGETAIEIGPGKGALTIPLVERCAAIGCALVAIEKDKTLGERLTKELGTRIVVSDALKILPTISQTLYPKPYCAVGNIPYYITGVLLRMIGELEHKPLRTVLMVQREVAERVVAAPPHMNLLAAATQIWANTELLFTLPASDFNPPPKVESSVIRLQGTGYREQVTGQVLQNYYRFIHAAFKQPRKTLLNNLLGDRTQVTGDREKVLSELQKLGYTEKTRAQELSIDQLIALSADFSSLVAKP